MRSLSDVPTMGDLLTLGLLGEGMAADLLLDRPRQNPVLLAVYFKKPVLVSLVKDVDFSMLPRPLQELPS